MRDSVAILWFRNDLRLHDNRVLAASVAAADRLLCVYIHDPRYDASTRWGFARMGVHRRRFLGDALMDLSNSLAAFGQRLHVLSGSPRAVLPALAEQFATRRVFCEQIAAPEERADIAALRAAGVEVTEIWQSSLLEPEDLPFAMGSLPRVFTEFRKRVEVAGVLPRAGLEVPSLTLPPVITMNDFLIDVASFLGSVAADSRSSFPYMEASFFGGESKGLAHLQRYFSGSLAQRYKETRNGLSGIDYSTKFSPWLATGAISPRVVYAALKSHEAKFGTNESTYWIWFELLWRDYFRFLHLAHGARLYTAAGLSNCAPPAHDDNAFRRWCEGSTEEPFIDAGMRELAATGYMSNRLRQNVASYLVNDLACDFRAGAAWFESQLVDYDVYSNQGNWLYLAGRGTDPRAGRRFEPVKQARDYDSNGRYRDLWNRRN